MAYLLRNEILTNIEDVRAELEYLIKLIATDPSTLNRSQFHMSKYLDLVPPQELGAAKTIITAKTK